MECLPFCTVTTLLLHPSVDNQELTLIHRKIVKTLPSHCDAVKTGCVHLWAQTSSGEGSRGTSSCILAKVPLNLSVGRTIGLRLLCTQTQGQECNVFLLRLFFISATPPCKSLWFPLESCSPKIVSLCYLRNDLNLFRLQNNAAALYAFYNCFNYEHHMLFTRLDLS